MVTFSQIQQTFDVVGEPTVVMTLDSNIRIIVTQRGGRLLGPFLSHESPSIFWTNPALAHPESFQTFIADGEWNMGGERVWIAPEIQYNIKDRTDFWGTHGIPVAMDPGRYSLINHEGTVYLRQQIELQAYNTASGTTHLDVERTIMRSGNPLRHAKNLDELMEGVRFAGYTQTVSLSLLGDKTVPSECWNLVQMNAGGMYYLPTHGPAQATPYFGTPTDDALEVSDGAYRIHLTGQQQFKTGYKATCLTGRMAYLNVMADETHYLLVRDFDNDPGNPYIEEPPDRPNERGHSVHIYNDGGQFGANAEMEANGHTIGGNSGSITATDSFRMWVFISQSEPALKRIASTLLGINL